MQYKVLRITRIFLYNQLLNDSVGPNRPSQKNEIKLKASKAISSLLNNLIKVIYLLILQLVYI